MTSALDQIDIHSPELYEARGYPWEEWALLRREAPVYWYDRPGAPPFWAITKYQDIQRISRDPKTFSNNGELTINTAPAGGGESPSGLKMHHLLEMDPPEHGQYRSLVNRRFTPRGLQILEDRIDELAAETIGRAAGDLIDRVASRRGVEFVAEVAEPFPLEAICELLGVPRESWEQIMAWGNDVIGGADPEVRQGRSERETMATGARALFGYFGQLAAQKQKEPGDDVMTTLVQARLDGKPLLPMDILAYAFILFLGGTETTRNAASGGLLALIQHPEQMQRLRSDRSLLDSAIEEMLRWTSPITHFARIVTTDVEIRGQLIPAGDKVVLWYPSANRDEDIFERADEFDISRSPNEHLAFGGFGEHFCIGANLARLELQAIFSHLLDRCDEIELDGEMERLRSGFVGGIKRLPISFTPR